jgi:hypothetical protein
MEVRWFNDLVEKGYKHFGPFVIELAVDLHTGHRQTAVVLEIVHGRKAEREMYGGAMFGPICCAEEAIVPVGRR